MIINEIIGNYSQTIRVNRNGNNEVEIYRNGECLFKGIAKHIIDIGQKISFKDDNDKQLEFIKYKTYSYS
jgi:hypothetical protein